MTKAISQIRLWLIPFLAPFILVGCGGNFRISLPNNYEMVSQYTGSVWIFGADGSSVIPGTVDGYVVGDGFVIGHTSLPRDQVLAKKYSNPGFFIINTKTDMVVQGLDKKNWIAHLKKLGLPTNPQLYTPAPLRILSEPWP